MINKNELLSLEKKNLAEKVAALQKAHKNIYTMPGNPLKALYGIDLGNEIAYLHEGENDFRFCEKLPNQK